MKFRLLEPIGLAVSLSLFSAVPLGCGGGGGGDDAGAGGTGTDAGSGGDGTLPGTGGDGLGTGGGTPIGGSTNYVIPEGRGASLPFDAYEAEAMETTGTLLGPSRTWTEIASEASGRQAVRLSAEGQYVQFTTSAASNSIVVRYSIPDGGNDYWTTLSFSINGGAEKKLNVTSRYSWSYGDMTGEPPVFNLPAQNDPGQGHPHHFFDEARLLVPEGIPAGAVVQVKKSAGDAAAHYDIDLVELEQVAEALALPSGFKSIVDCGANGADALDDSAEVQSCIDNFGGQGIYIPAGRFIFDENHVNVANVTVRGAGMWHSTIGGSKARFVCTGDNCKYYDFAVFGETTARDDGTGGSDDAAFDGPQNSGVVLDHIWIEHRRVGYWTGLYPDSGDDNVLIKDSRFRNLHADGINFYGGATNSTVENCHFRNTGDDAIAAWSHNANGHGPNSGNAFRKNTIQSTWMANCFGIYGGSDTTVEDNVCLDTIQLAGILVAQAYDSHPFGGTNSFARNSLIRNGGDYRYTKQGALKLEPRQGGLANLAFTDLDLVDSTYYGISVVGGQSDAFQVGTTTFDQVNMLASGEYGIFLPAEARGTMSISNSTVSDSPGLLDSFDNQFTLVKGAGNVGF